MSQTFAAFRDRRFRLAAFVLALANLWFFSALPVIGLAGSVHDDQLFLQLGDSIAHGHWLGEYSRFTLMKGCGYPLFIAGAFLAGLPLPLAEHLFYLCGCWLVVRAARPLLIGDTWALGLFALLAWQPMSYWIDPTGGNVLRQNLYTPLTLLVFAGLVALHTRAAAPCRVQLGWSALLGLAFGWLWLTREESVWIIPCVALLAIVATLLRLLAPAAHRWGAVAPLGVAAMCAALPIVVVCALNYRYYRWYGTVEFRAPAFVGAYGALNRVRPYQTGERCAVARPTRELIYAVSPTFAQLRPQLEGPMGVRWSNTWLDYSGALWMWALREAVQNRLHPRDAREALAFYQRIADEVNAACADGRLSAGPRRDSFLPPWTPVDTAILRREGWPYLRDFLSFAHFNVHPPHSLGQAEALKIFRDMTHWTLAYPDQANEVDTPRIRSYNTWRIGALQAIGRALRVVCVAAEIAGALAWLYVFGQALVRRHWPAYLWWLASAALGGAAAVFLIGLLVHVTAWADWRPLRFAQAYPLLLLFAVAAFAAALARPVPAPAGSPGAAQP